MIKSQRLAIIMLGPPGAGKGTQARLISESLKFPHISTGDILREALRTGSELGNKARPFIESGGLAPDDLVDAIVAERLEKEDCREGFILDGYPRTIPQAEFLSSVLGKDKTRLLSIGIEVGTPELIRRLSSRWTCPKCGKMFNANLDPGKAGGNCDGCGAALVQRKDDSVEVITERLRVYRDATQPLIDYYRDCGCYVEVNGERPVNDIFDSVMRIIKSG